MVRKSSLEKNGGGQHMACDCVLLRFPNSRKALQHGSIIFHWLTQVGVVFQASMNSRVLYVEPFPTTEARLNQTHRRLNDNEGPEVNSCPVA